MLVAHDIVAGYIEGIDILQGVSIEVPEGRIVSVVGPNGSGKSTLMRVICGFLKPRRGRVRYDERELTGLPAHKLSELGVCYLPQERTVYPHLAVEDNIRLGGWSFRRDTARLARAMERVYGQFPMMRERRRTKAGALSGGMQKILELARGMVIEPRLLICDEPTVGLAPVVAKEVYATLERFRDDKLTILLVDQNVREAVKLGDHVYVLELGQNRIDGSREEFETDLHAMIKEWLQI